MLNTHKHLPRLNYYLIVLIRNIAITAGIVISVLWVGTVFLQALHSGA